MTAAIIVVGAGQAGCQLVSSLREGGYDGPLTLIGQETHLPYQRPPLSKGYLTGKAGLDSLWLRPSGWYSDNLVDVRAGTSVVSLDRVRRVVQLSDGSTLPYSRLVLATGARNRNLDIEGTDLAGVVLLRTLDEADRIRNQIGCANHVVVIGGGFIGMEVASTAASLGKTTTVVEVANQLMGRVLSSETAAFLLAAHRSRGLNFEMATSISRIVGAGGRATAVDTSDGRRIDADLVLIGVGAVPNVELAAAAGLTVDNGIVVDEFLCTADRSVHAIGDCACAPNPFDSTGQLRVRLESVQNAVAQARCLASSILDRPAPYFSVPWFWSDQADLKLQIAGLTAGHDAIAVKGEVGAEKFSVYCFAAERLIGVESVNRPAEHMAARRLLARLKPLSLDQVAADDFDPKAYAAAGLAS